MNKLRLLVGATAMLMPLAFSPLSASGAALNTFQTTTPETLPPLHGTLPHGEGTVAVTQLASDPTRPYSDNPTGGGTPNELLVVGRSRGEQRADGTFHGHITIAAVAGVELLMVDSNPGETHNAPTAAVTDPICASIGVCAVTATSSTTATGSTNHFETAGLHLAANQATTPGLTLPLGVGLLSATAASSDGNITTDGICMTATGQSTVAGAALGPTILAKLIKTSTISKACNNAAPTETDSSTVIPADPTITGLLTPLPASGCASGGTALPDGTAGGVANDPTKGGLTLAGVLDIICNSADQSPAAPSNAPQGAQQATSPYGVREALDVFVLATSATPLIKLTTAAADSTATAPPCPANTTASAGGCTPTPCPAGQVGTQPNCTTPVVTKPASGHVCNTGGDNDCVTGSGPRGPSIPEGGKTDTARDCKEGVENTPASACPGNSGAGGGGNGNSGAQTRSTLPFTGLDPLPVAILGMLLLGTGLAMRRFSGLVD